MPLKAWPSHGRAVRDGVDDAAVPISATRSMWREGAYCPKSTSYHGSSPELNGSAPFSNLDTFDL